MMSVEQRRRDVAGRLIIFEGVDATGKTALTDELCNVSSRSIQRHHFPGDCPGSLGELVNRVHHHHERDFEIQSINPCSLQLLHIAAHIDVIESSIKQSVISGNWVVLDRFWWSTYVYGVENGVNEEPLKLMIDIEKRAWGEMSSTQTCLGRADSVSTLLDIFSWAECNLLPFRLYLNCR